MFRRRKTGEVWTTCCRRHEVAPDSPIWDEVHMREPRNAWRQNSKDYMYSRCPYCRAKVKVKDLQYTGKRDNLCAYRKAVVLRLWRGKLWAVAMSLKKSYTDKEWLTEPPEAAMQAVYRYDKDGYVTTKHHWYWGWSNPKKINYEDFRDRTADRPFTSTVASRLTAPKCSSTRRPVHAAGTAKRRA